MARLDDVLLQDPERTRVLADIRAQCDAWGISLPDVVPYPIHFGLNRFLDVGETEFWIANEQAAGYCGKFLFVFEGQTCPMHYHRIKHETFYIVKGSVSMWIDDDQRVMRSGDVLVMPVGTRHRFTGLGGPALVLEVSMPSIPNDSFFDDPQIGVL